MDKIHFIVGGVGSGRKPIVSRLRLTLKGSSAQPSLSKIALGSFSATSITEASQDKWKQYCIEQIQNHLDLFAGKEHHIITGPLLSIHIKSIFELYPNSTLYLLKSLNSDMFSEAASNLKNENVSITTEDILNYNNQVNQQMDQLVSQLSLEWKYVEAPIFNQDGSINFVENPETPNILIAAYNA
jgi:hypothetical protein